METPSPHTPGGMKGMTEGGTIGAPATIANAATVTACPLTVPTVFALLRSASR